MRHYHASVKSWRSVLLNPLDENSRDSFLVDKSTNKSYIKVDMKNDLYEALKKLAPKEQEENKMDSLFKIFSQVRKEK